jgi:hypothetical protein|tara:strand:- start:79 stop:516 length:438 start_codon:yes stop_codon:yes gene_type:complete
MTVGIEVLNFNIGGFGGGYERVIWQDNKLHYQFSERPFYDDEEKLLYEKEEQIKVLNVTSPSIKDWEEFWKVIDALKVWSWKKSYYDENVDDGTQWELKIKRQGRRRRRMFGSNAYPEPRGTFDSFIKALNKLSNSKIGFEEEEF